MPRYATGAVGEVRRVSYSLGEAARATGRNKSTILRAVRAGKISATREEARGGWMIEPAELHRVFAPVAATPDEPASAAIGNGNATAAAAELRARLADAHETIADLRAERDRLLSLHEQDQRLLADLRERPQPRHRWWRFNR
jgi:hypothetical protein